MAPDTFHWWMDLDDLDLMYDLRRECSSLYVSPELVTCPGCTPPLTPGEPVTGPLHDPIKEEEDGWKDIIFS